jgi:hypothetical protein
MPNLPTRSKKTNPLKLPSRASLLMRFVRWRGPVGSAKTGVALVRHRRAVRIGLSTARVTARVAPVVAAIGATVAVVRRLRRKTATVT